MKLPSGEKVSPAIRVRCCLEEGGKSETAKNQKSHRKVQHCEEPRGENNQGQVENLSMSMPTTVQGCCWMGPAPPTLEHPTSHTEAHKSSMFIQPLGEPLSYQQQLSEGTRSTRCCCRLDLHHPRLRTSDQLAHENCQAPEKQPSHLLWCSYRCTSCHNTHHQSPSCSSHHLLVLCQQVGGSQAEGPHHAAVESTGEDPLGGVEGHSTRHLISSCEVVQLQGKQHRHKAGRSCTWQPH